MLQVCNTEKKTEGKLKAIIETINEFFFFFADVSPFSVTIMMIKEKKKKRKKAKLQKAKLTSFYEVNLAT